MTTKDKGRTRQGATPKTSDTPDHSGFIAIKPSRINRQQKRRWQRGGRK